MLAPIHSDLFRLKGDAGSSRSKAAKEPFNLAFRAIRFAFSFLVGLKRSSDTRPVIGVGEDEIAAGQLPLDPAEPPVPPVLAILDLDLGHQKAVGGKDRIAKNAGLLDVRD